MSARTEPLNLTARELVMLGHCLNFVPSNACLTGNGWGGFALVYETKEYAALRRKVGRGLKRPDAARYLRPGPTNGGETT